MKVKFLLGCVLLILFSCKEDYTPKPRAFLKLQFPEKIYQDYNTACPFTFQFPEYATIQEQKENCYMNIYFPYFKGTLFITYLPLKDNLYEHIEQSRSLAYKHNTKAEAISEQVFIDEKNKVYGMMYDYDGLTATAAQFYITDSIHHFFRGSLYYNTEINDSILPINIFIKKDIRHLIESFRWKDK